MVRDDSDARQEQSAETYAEGDALTEEDVVVIFGKRHHHQGEHAQHATEDHQVVEVALVKQPSSDYGSQALTLAHGHRVKGYAH